MPVISAGMGRFSDLRMVGDTSAKMPVTWEPRVTRLASGVASLLVGVASIKGTGEAV